MWIAQTVPYPFYMVYIGQDGSTVCDYLSPKELLDLFCGCSAKAKPNPDQSLCQQFNQATDDGKNRFAYSAGGVKGLHPFHSDAKEESWTLTVCPERRYDGPAFLVSGLDATSNWFASCGYNKRWDQCFRAFHSTEFNKRIPKQKFYGKRRSSCGSQAIVCRPAALYLLAQIVGGVHLESHCRRAGTETEIEPGLIDQNWMKLFCQPTVKSPNNICLFYENKVQAWSAVKILFATSSASVPPSAYRLTPNRTVPARSTVCRLLAGLVRQIARLQGDVGVPHTALVGWRSNALRNVKNCKSRLKHWRIRFERKTVQSSGGDECGTKQLKEFGEYARESKVMELNDFKRFTHLTVEDIPETAKLIVLSF